MAKCLITGNEIDTFLNFGKMPIANGFLTKDQFKEEFFFELKVGFDAESKMVQLTELVDEKQMFHENYAFFSGTSQRMAVHFKEFADWVKSRFLKEAKDPFVCEIGSNDGIMLQHFANDHIRHLGIEPSANVAKVAMDKGLETIIEFFNVDLAKKIIEKHGQADAYLGANVMCHIPYIHSVMQGISLLLKPSGVLIFEDPYMGDVYQKTSYDQIYDEHAFYYTVSSVDFLVKQHGMEVVDILHHNMHGGSMRYVIAHTGQHKISPEVSRQKMVEKTLGLYSPETYLQFKNHVEQSRDSLMTLLNNLKKQGSG